VLAQSAIDVSCSINHFKMKILTVNTPVSCQKQNLKSRRILRLTTAFALLAATLAPPAPAQVIDPASTYEGETYGQWSASWWQWGLSLPVTGSVPHPFTDDPAFDVTEGQTGQVWFLGAPFGTVQRTCNIPEGKSLFIGLLNAEDSGLEDPGSTAAEQLASAQAQADLIQNVAFNLDGVAITNIGSYRVQSPQFTFTAPTPWLFGATGGSSTSVSDGYFVMLEPLAPGTHTLHYSGAIPSYGLAMDMTYNFMVIPTNSVFSATASLYGKTCAEYSAGWWQWNFSLPTTNNPLQDNAPISTGQNGNVWYLGGTFGSSGTRVRSGNVPMGTALFFPILDAWADNTDCPNPDHYDTETLRGLAQGYIDAASNMTCTIDGATVADLTNSITSQYRVQSPVFSYSAPAAHNFLYDLFGATCYTNGNGTPFAVDGAVADGVYLMLAPFSAGQHTIHFTGEISGSSEDITYNLTVVPAASSIYATNAVVDGQDYGQWSASWWQWAMALPVTGPVPHPFTDDPAFDVTEGQTGSVWFLGAPLDTAVRTCNIPEGKTLLVGLLNAEDSGLEDPGSTAAEQLASAQATADLFSNLSFSLDGVALANIDSYRVQSPQFTFSAPTPWLFGPTGGTSTSVSDGYFVMLAPPAPGTHTLHYSGTVPSYGLAMDMTYHLTVVPASGVYASEAEVAGQDYSQWEAAWWQWGMSLPLAGNPFNDDPAFDVTAGQTGSVWFLASPLDTNARACHIPDGKTLFVGLLNAEDSELEDPGSTEAEQRASAQFQADHIGNITFSVDGTALANIGDYRLQSPQFSFTAPTPWIFGATGGTNTSVGDGYFVMVPPLPPGAHTLRSTGTFHFAVAEGDPFNFDAATDTTYHLTVTGPELGLGLQGTNLVFAWPQTGSRYVLESTPTLGDPSWSPVTGTVNTSGGNYQITAPIGVGAQFFRLRKQ